MKNLKSAALRHYFFLPVLLLVGCATYYQKNIIFQDYFSKGQIEKANAVLNKNKKAATGNNRLLYFLQKGVVEQLLENYQESNNYFEQAYFFTEDYRKNYSREALSYLINPNVIPYVGEDHEKVLIHYFKALNFLRIGQLDEALVECRRINIKLNELNDRYENKKNRYSVDPFAHNLMGIIFEASGEINDAFIAYRNAYDGYVATQNTLGVAPPKQLKQDILRTAYLNGFNNELNQYEKEFGIKYDHEILKDGELILFWHNGLGPVKSEWTINFFVVKGQGGVVYFENKELGMSFPFVIPQNDDGSSKLGDLKIIRVAFPKYVDRATLFTSAQILIDNKSFELEKAEDISSIAFITLEDRMIREFANSLLRLAVKQATEIATRKENENLGALLSIVNASTEKADTRNWQTLPHDISYSRIPLKVGKNDVTLKINQNGKENVRHEFIFDGHKGETIFYIFNSLETKSPFSVY